MAFGIDRYKWPTVRLRDGAAAPCGVGDDHDDEGDSDRADRLIDLAG
ncbi:MAG: hypothetical protein H7234_05060 [Herminiimonas sp.]|nr:hypothetical protein [Herminiimonas sp.]